jgi:hypothetical protein
MAETTPYYGNRLVGDLAPDAAYVLARIRYLVLNAPNPTPEGWGARPDRKEELDEVAANLIAATKAQGFREALAEVER